MVVRHTMLEQLGMTEMAHNLLLLFSHFFYYFRPQVFIYIKTETQI